MAVSLDEYHKELNTASDEEFSSSDDEPLSEYFKRRNENEVIAAAADHYPTKAKQRRINKFKEAKARRQKGKEYYSPSTKKVVPAKTIGPMCNKANCLSHEKRCADFSEDQRKKIHSDFHSIEDLTRQREYIVTHIKTYKVKRKTTTALKPRRKCTNHYFLRDENDQMKRVCLTMFLSTLGITEKIRRTAMLKQQPSGNMEKDKRGGRQKACLEKDAEKRKIIEEHIKRFQAVNSSSCGKYRNKECRHGTLNVTKMYNEFKAEINQNISRSLYGRVFKEFFPFYRTRNSCDFYKQIITDKEE